MYLQSKVKSERGPRHLLYHHSSMLHMIQCLVSLQKHYRFALCVCYQSEESDLLYMLQASRFGFPMSWQGCPFQNRNWSLYCISTDLKQHHTSALLRISKHGAKEPRCMLVLMITQNSQNCHNIKKKSYKYVLMCILFVKIKTILYKKKISEKISEPQSVIWF